MSDVLFFDAFTQIGPRRDKHPAEAWRLDQLLAEMHHCSISGALVSATQSVICNPMLGNLAVSQAIQPHNNLFACWNVMPGQQGDFPAPAELARWMRKHAVQAVMIYPKTNAWDWLAPHAQPLFRWLAKERILTIIRRHEFDQYRELDAFLAQNRRLPLLLTGAGYDEQRFVLPLVERYRSLHISFDMFQVHYGIEDLVAAGHEDQLLFATTAPKMSMGAHRAYIDYADIPAAAKRKIAGGNLARLLNGQTPPSIVRNTDEDILMAAVRQGKPLPVPVIDMHVPVTADGPDGNLYSCRMSHGDLNGLLPLMRRMGYAGGGLMSSDGPAGDSRGGNEILQRIIGRAPRGFWALATFDTNHFTPAELKAAIPEVYKDGRFIGMKPYHFYPKDYTDPSYDVWWKFGNRHQLYTVIDRNYTSDFREVENLARRFPRVRWVVAHTGRDFKRADQAGEVVAKYKNVYPEINLGSVPLGMIDYLVERCGPDRVLYGSDTPVLDPRQPLGWVVFSRLPLADKIKVLSTNALRVIRPCKARLPEYNRPPGL